MKRHGSSSMERGNHSWWLLLLSALLCGRCDRQLGVTRRQAHIVPPTLAKKSGRRGDDEEDDAEPRNCFARAWAWASEVIDPDNMWKFRWDLVMVVCTLYSLFMTPFQLSFGEVGPLGGVDIAMDVAFVIDLVLQSRTSFVKGMHEIEMDGWVVFKRYLMGWFFVDAVAAVPVELIIAITNVLDAGDSVPSRGLQLMRLLRFTRLLRVSRLFAFGNRFRFTNSVRLMKLGECRRAARWRGHVP